MRQLLSDTGRNRVQLVVGKDLETIRDANHAKLRTPVQQADGLLCRMTIEDKPMLTSVIPFALLGCTSRDGGQCRRRPEQWNFRRRPARPVSNDVRRRSQTPSPRKNHWLRQAAESRAAPRSRPCVGPSRAGSRAISRRDRNSRQPVSRGGENDIRARVPCVYIAASRGHRRACRATAAHRPAGNRPHPGTHGPRPWPTMYRG
jgi:hypothetical protein